MNTKNLVGGNNEYSRRDFVKFATVAGVSAIIGTNIEPAYADISKDEFEEMMNSEPPYTIRDSAGYEFVVNMPISNNRFVSGSSTIASVIVPGPRSDPDLETGFSRGYTDPETGFLRLSIRKTRIQDEENYNAYKNMYVNADTNHNSFLDGDIISMEHLGRSQVSKDNYLFKLQTVNNLYGTTSYDSELVMFDDQKRIMIEISSDLECNIYGLRESTPEQTSDLISDYVTSMYKEIMDSFTYWDGTEPIEEFEPKVGYYTYQPDFNSDAKPVDLEFLWPTGFDWLKNHPEESRKAGVTLSAAAYKDDVERILSNLGMDNIEHWDENNCKHFSGDSTLTFKLAHQTLEDGKELICVVGRGTADDSEWYDNILHGINSTFLDSDHVGFRLAAVGVRGQIQEYIDKLVAQGIKQDDMCFYFTGHSRAAAVMNLVAESYVSNQLYPGSVVTDTFATPNTRQNSAPASSEIKNYVNTDDIVTMVPFNGKKAGTTYGYKPNNQQVMDFYGVSKLNGISIVDNHMPEDLVAKVYGQNSPNVRWSNSGWIEAGFHCQLDVEIYDEAGELVAKSIGSTNDDDAVFHVSLGVLATEYNNEKLFYLPADQEYTVKTYATGGGEMTHRVLQSNGSDEPIVLIEQTNIPVVEIDGQTTIVGEEIELLASDAEAETENNEFKIISVEYIIGGAAGALATGAVAAGIAIRNHRKKNQQ